MAEAGYDTCLDGRAGQPPRETHSRFLPRGAESTWLRACGIRKEGHGIWGERYCLPFDEVYRHI